MSHNPPGTDAATNVALESESVSAGEQSNDRTPDTPANAEDNSVPQETAKTYPTHVRNPVDRFEPTW